MCHHCRQASDETEEQRIKRRKDGIARGQAHNNALAEAAAHNRANKAPKVWTEEDHARAAAFLARQLTKEQDTK